MNAILWFETRRFATLLTMRIASLDLILRSRRRRRLEGEVVTLLFQLYLSAYGVKPGNDDVEGLGRWHKTRRAADSRVLWPMTGSGRVTVQFKSGRFRSA